MLLFRTKCFIPCPGLTSSPSKLQCDSSPVFDPSLRSDMLMSLNTGEDPEMSVQQSLHIGVAPGDLQVTKIRLLSDEEMAKGTVYTGRRMPYVMIVGIQVKL